MESYCVFLMGQFIATVQFQKDFGVYSDVAGGYIIEASWQSAFQCSGPVGAFIGVFIAGPITTWIGYRWATIGGLMFLNCFIFIFYFFYDIAYTPMLIAYTLEILPFNIRAKGFAVMVSFLGRA